MKSLASNWAFCLILPLTLGSQNGLAQSVQLPSFETYGAGTTVLVPDRGSMSLGGVGSAAAGRGQFGGLPGNISRGSATGASGVSVSAQVHDMDAYDKAVLARAARHRAAKGLVAGAANAAGPVSENLPAATTPAAVASVAQLAARRAAAQGDIEREAQELFDRGRQAQAAGKLRTARIYFQMAARRATGNLKSDALAAIRDIGTSLARTEANTPR